MFRKFSQWFDNPPPKNAPDNRACDHSGCDQAGIYRAPKSRHQLENGVNDWYWLCLTHIRDYNNSWNYYANMTEEQINRERVNDVTWNRPSWTFGDQPTSFQLSFQDPFGFFGTDHQEPKAPFISSAEQDALTLLKLSIPFTREQLQKNYRLLVKQYHPDANQNTNDSDEMIRRINQAYSLLQKIEKK